MALRRVAKWPWIVLRDFNEIMAPLKVSGGVYSQHRAEKFISCTDSCGLMDLGAIGHKFTWSRRVQGNRLVSKHLDRALACCDWRVMFSGPMWRTIVVSTRIKARFLFVVGVSEWRWVIIL